MKSSEILQIALDTHYGTSFKAGTVPFMCIAVTRVIHDQLRNQGLDGEEMVVTSTPLVKRVTDYFMPFIHKTNDTVLTNHLKKVNDRYRMLTDRWGHNAPSCQKIRIEWFADIKQTMISNND